MVASYRNLVLMRQAVEPVNLGLDFGRRTGVGEVAGVDEKVTVGDIIGFEAMRVADAYYAN